VNIYAVTLNGIDEYKVIQECPKSYKVSGSGSVYGRSSILKLEISDNVEMQGTQSFYSDRETAKQNLVFRLQTAQKRYEGLIADIKRRLKETMEHGRGTEYRN